MKTTVERENGVSLTREVSEDNLGRNWRLARSIGYIVDSAYFMHIIQGQKVT